MSIMGLAQRVDRYAKYKECLRSTPPSASSFDILKVDRTLLAAAMKGATNSLKVLSITLPKNAALDPTGTPEDNAQASSAIWLWAKLKIVNSTS
jgi:hypothetical protein